MQKAKKKKNNQNLKKENKNIAQIPTSSKTVGENKCYNTSAEPIWKIFNSYAFS